ncbi:hypothetical protein FQJ88_13875 [Xanthomonas vasicola]|uniref:Uncharacterized protein n=1 Tax=Xanthomonas vasicola TaxID=56459 RepID=A0ABD7S9T6_XANVA|nr:hypothetical protein NX81_002065 [Xanthomonas vasicola]TWQ26692.1 hypothetical protein FQJ97_02065 [Xanthomonas vasicola]TWQ35967.1 hypothetical protein FQJ96_16785 [Xanthomonas vasicola]TWQ52149.1 hypothetical protein FQK01_13490 [Xanthomonas vasicola]TWQ56217.1 hypothetical protein FQJ94_09130 [Xanthomonas vasicola]
MCHLQCDTRMTDYAAPKLTEMFVTAEIQRRVNAAACRVIAHHRVPISTSLLKRVRRRIAIVPMHEGSCARCSVAASDSDARCVG